MRTERIAVTQLHARLRSIGAQYRADRSSNVAHIYWSPPLRQWVKVVRDGANVAISYHATCPCSGG